MRSVIACLPSPPRLLVMRVLYVLLALLCAAGLVTAAILVPAPAGALPAVVALVIGLPMLAARELPAIIAAIRVAARHARALAGLGRELKALPETRHPLGL